MSLSRKLQYWVDARLIAQDQRENIIAYEKIRNANRWKHGFGYIGILSILLGIALIIASNWQAIPADLKLGGHFTVNAVLAWLVWQWRDNPDRLPHREGVLFVLWGLTLTLIALIGQIFQLSGETYEAVRLWFWITTPMIVWFAQGRYLTALWAILFTVYVPYDIFFSIIEGIENEAVRVHAGLAIAVLLPPLLWFMGTQKVLRDHRPALGQSLRTLGIIVALGTATFAGAVYYADNTGWMLSPIIPIAIGAFPCIILLLARKSREFDTGQRSMIDLILMATLFACVPFFAFVPFSFMAMIHFIAFWLAACVLFQRGGFDRAVGICIALVTLRLFIGFLELFGSMMMSGFGFILIGLVLIGLVYAARHVKKWMQERGAA